MAGRSGAALPRTVSVTFAAAGFAMFLMGAARLTADFADIPGNVAVEAFEAGRPLTGDQVSRVIDTRMKSISNHATADRWFTLGRAYLAAEKFGKARDAYAAGLALGPARGAGWAGYARALARSGDREKAAEASAYSIRRARHDPAAKRLRP